MRTWQSTREQPYGEDSDAAYRLALRGRGEALNDEFQDLATAVFAPLLAHCDH